MARRTKAPSTLLLEQFKRQAYYSLYVNGRTLVEFTAMMDKLFKKIRDDTQVELQVGYNQWQTRKRAWDSEWKITEGGPSTEARYELDKLPIWFDGNNDWLKQSYVKLEEPKSSLSSLSLVAAHVLTGDRFEKATKPYTSFEFTKPAQTFDQPGWKGINRASESQVPERAFASDTINFDYTDVTTSNALTCMPALYPKLSYNNSYPVECLDAQFGEAVLPSEQLLGMSNPLNGQKGKSALMEEYSSPEKFPLAYNSSVFNEDVSNFDHENWEQFSAAVNTHHSKRTTHKNCESFQSHHAQGPLHTPPLTWPKEQRPSLNTPFQSINMCSYGGRP